MGRLVVLLLLWSLSAAAPAGVYRWVDAQGNTHFGDAPPNGEAADNVQLKYNEVGSTPVPPGLFQSRPQVIVYSASWCGVCARAKAFLKANAIPFSEYDVETSDKGQHDYARLGGRGVPIILVGEQRMDGFNPATLTAWLRQGGYAAGGQ